MAFKQANNHSYIYHNLCTIQSVSLTNRTVGVFTAIGEYIAYIRNVRQNEYRVGIIFVLLFDCMQECQ